MNENTIGRYYVRGVVQSTEKSAYADDRNRDSKEGRDCTIRVDVRCASR